MYLIEEIYKSVYDLTVLFVHTSMLVFKFYWQCFSLTIYLLAVCFVMMIFGFCLLKLVIYFVPSGDRKKLNVAFFHPYCNAGGGGERVLWTAIRAIQLRYPSAECHIYTGDLDASPEQILANVKQRFNVTLERSPHFIYLKFRKIVEAQYYPYFTLLGQSLGSIILAGEALARFRPELFVDTMGYAFSYPVFWYLGGSAVASYTHYPTISSDMLSKVSARTEAHNNQDYIARSFLLSSLKLFYYNIFALIYGLVGNCAKVVMVNSTWTKGHLDSLWKCNDKLHIVYPPCDTVKFSSLPLIPDEEKELKTIVSIGQFRPEKDFPLQLRAFKCLLQRLDDYKREQTRLVLIGGVRNQEDEGRVESLKRLAKEISVEDKVVWKINASFADLMRAVQEGTIGIHTMWNEHFGIGVVECMAGGLIMLAHNSGGPKFDIVKPFEGKRTGFLASDEESYADHMQTILSLSSEEKSEIRKAAMLSVTRFSDDVFIESFLSAMSPLVDPSHSN